MKHLTHLIATDARRFAVLLAAWVVVVAASTVLEGVRPAVAIDRRLREALSVIGSLLSLVVLLLTFVVISFVVHAHPTVGTDAFWMTRPVPPGALLAGKLVLLGVVLVVVPALGACPSNSVGRVQGAAGTRRAHGGCGRSRRCSSSPMRFGIGFLLAPRSRLASPMRATHAITRTGS